MNIEACLFPPYTEIKMIYRREQNGHGKDDV